MKILQLNIWAGRLNRQIIDVVLREKPDVVCFQEVVKLPGKESVFISTLDDLQEELQFQQVSYAPLFSFGYMNRTAEFGDCVMSHLPIVSDYVEFTRQEYIENMDYLEREDYNVNHFQHVVIMTPSGPLNVLNHHGHHVHGHKKGNEETMRQCGRMAEYVTSLGGSVVLCGDFNLEPTSESLEQINNVLVNHVKERAIQSTRTPLTHKTEACDYIFTSPDITVTNFQVLDDVASDHKALIVEF